MLRAAQKLRVEGPQGRRHYRKPRKAPSRRTVLSAENSLRRCLLKLAHSRSFDDVTAASRRGNFAQDDRVENSAQRLLPKKATAV
jgi:hypothetical protein